MSQLETNTASLQAILDSVNALPEAGSGGGGGGVTLPTCSVRCIIYADGPAGMGSVERCCTIVEDGALTQAYTTGEAIKENVVCGTPIIISADGLNIADVITTHGYCDYMDGSLAVVSLIDNVSDGDTVTITVYAEE